ncbi:phosphoribosylanthranilate isomerase [Desulfatiferula olefinivorans]
MPDLEVQIYEIQTPDEADTLIDLGVSRLGSVLVSATDWKVPAIRDTIRLARSRSVESSLIPLFSDADLIARVIDWYEPDIIHLCESLPGPPDINGICETLIDLQRQVKQRFPGVRIMRSIPIAQTGLAHRVPTLELALLFEPVSDLFLTDTLIVTDGGKADEQPVEGFVGITGLTCDWDMARKLVEQSRLPVILAGGLSPDNVFEAAVATRPAGVDSCTRTNAVDPSGKPVRFKKDPDKVRTFVREARRAAESINKTMTV